MFFRLNKTVNQVALREKYLDEGTDTIFDHLWRN